MNHPLDGARLKVVRAQEHLETLKNKIGAYLDDRPYESFVQIEGNLVKAYRPIVNQPDLTLGTIVGDCVCCLMAALDYIIWELASRYAGRELIPPPNGKDKPSFPLYNDKSGFDKNRQRFTHYKIPTAAISEVENVQPYNTGYESLFTLYHLVNQDKHRLPVIGTADFEDDGFTVSVLGGGSATGHHVTSMTLNAGFESVPDDISSRVKVKAQPAVYVTLRHFTMPREPIDRILEQIIKCVANVIPRFDPFLS